MIDGLGTRWREELTAKAWCKEDIKVFEVQVHFGSSLVAEGVSTLWPPAISLA
jgi:hypothetical protein